MKAKEPSDPVALLATHLGVSEAVLQSVRLVRRSLDSRARVPVWRGVFRVEATHESALLGSAPGVRLWTDRDDARYAVVVRAAERRRWPQSTRIAVVGGGPAGLFAALYLAEAGASVILFERGSPVDDRIGEVNGHWRRKQQLDPESNVVFGEGGAGTFSDGKIYTRRRDGDVGYILRRFVDFGADEEILSEGWAHLGTDKVRAILPVFRRRLEELGVEVRFRTRVVDVVVESGRAAGVVLADGRVEPASHVLVAAGHSARDTLRMMASRGAEAVARPIAVGARVEHPQTLVDAGRYRGRSRDGLPPASYRLACELPNGLKARTFCMCPGGMVVPASPEPGRVVVNGMSFSSRRSFWANSAVIVEVPPSMFGGEDPLSGLAWQDAIERRAYEAAGSDERAPAQRVDDFLGGRPSDHLGKVSFPLGVAPADLTTVLPPRVVDGMRGALKRFERTIPGFAGAEGVLIAPETRTTSPLRFLRDPSYQSTTLRRLYPLGEGAGYGGGIVSCALDGLRAARAIASEVDTLHVAA